MTILITLHISDQSLQFLSNSIPIPISNPSIMADGHALTELVQRVLKCKHWNLSVRSSEITKSNENTESGCQKRQGPSGSRLGRATASVRPSASLVTVACAPVHTGPRPASIQSHKCLSERLAIRNRENSQTR